MKFLWYFAENFKHPWDTFENHWPKNNENNEIYMQYTWNAPFKHPETLIRHPWTPLRNLWDILETTLIHHCLLWFVTFPILIWEDISSTIMADQSDFWASLTTFYLNQQINRFRATNTIYPKLRPLSKSTNQQRFAQGLTWLLGLY